MGVGVEARLIHNLRHHDATAESEHVMTLQRTSLPCSIRLARTTAY